MEMEPRGQLKIFRLPHMVVSESLLPPEQLYRELRSWRDRAHSHESSPLRESGGSGLHVIPGLALCLDTLLLWDF